jgi:hypothetical protein
MSYMEAAVKWIGDNAAIIVALCAFGVAVYQAYATRRHNRLSVRPHLVVFTERHNDNGKGKFAVTLRNSGLGPAIIRSYGALLHDEPLSTRDGMVIKNTVSKVIGRDAPHVGFHRLVKGDSVAKDQEMTLLSIAFACPTPPEYQAVMKSLDRLSAAIEYQSIYGEKFKYDSRTAGT